MLYQRQVSPLLHLSRYRITPPPTSLLSSLSLTLKNSSKRFSSISVTSTHFTHVNNSQQQQQPQSQVRSDQQQLLKNNNNNTFTTTNKQLYHSSYTMVEKQKEQQQQLDQYQTTSMHFGPYKDDKIFSVQKETLKDGLQKLVDNYKEIDLLYKQEFLTTQDKYGKKNVLSAIIKSVSIQMGIEENLLIPLVRAVGDQDGDKWAEEGMSGTKKLHEMMQQLWDMIGTSENGDAMDKCLSQFMQQWNTQHREKFLNDILPLIRDKLNGFHLNTLYQLVTKTQSQAKEFPSAHLSWLTGHEVNEYDQFISDVTKEIMSSSPSSTQAKTKYIPKYGYHKFP